MGFFDVFKSLASLLPARGRGAQTKRTKRGRPAPLDLAASADGAPLGAGSPARAAAAAAASASASPSPQRRGAGGSVSPSRRALAEVQVESGPSTSYYITHASPDAAATPAVRGVAVSPGARAPGARVVLRSTPFGERVEREVAKEAAFRRALKARGLR